MNRILLALTLVIPLAACSTAAPPKLFNARSPVDSSVGLRNVHHHNPVGIFASRAPVGPKAWKQLNEDQAPQDNKKVESGPETPVHGLDDPNLPAAIPAPIEAGAPLDGDNFELVCANNKPCPIKKDPNKKDGK